VDFSCSFPWEFGTFDFPFNTLAEGLNAVPYGGFLKIMTGTSGETASINKRMHLQSYGGPVTLGH
jgi:hypothetical protein